MATMRAVRRTEDGIRTLQVPEPEGDGVRVHVRAAGICGSDLHALSFGPSDITVGHEFGGVLDDGTAVAVRPNLPAASATRADGARTTCAPTPPASCTA